MASKLQTFTRRRNWAKGRVASSLNQLRRLQSDKVLSTAEQKLVIFAINQLELVVENWDLRVDAARRINGV